MDIGRSIYQMENSSTSYRFARSFYNDYSFHLHMHSDVELVYLQHGELEVIVDGTTHLLHKNDLLFVFPNQIHRFSTPDTSRSCVCVFSQNLIPTFCQATSQKVCIAPVIHIGEEVNDSFDIFNKEPQLSLFSIQSCLYRICSLLEADRFIPSSTAQDCSLLHQILMYCMEHYKENISLKHFAQTHGYNPTYCSQCFHSSTSVNFREFVNLIRIQQSKQQLTETSKSITEIAFDCGFQNIRTFNRAFFAAPSMSPREFRHHFVENSISENHIEHSLHQIFVFHPRDTYEEASTD